MVNKISRAPTKGAQLQDSHNVGSKPKVLQVAAGAITHGKQSSFKTSWRKRLTSSPKCGPEDPERKYHFVTLSPSSTGGFPGSQHALVHIPNSEQQFLGTTQQGTHSSHLWERSTSRHLHVGICLAYYFKLLLNPIMDLFLFWLAGFFKYFLNFGTECSLTRESGPYYADETSQKWRPRPKPAPREAWSWKESARRNVPLL